MNNWAGREDGGGWRARRRARIERVAAGGPLWLPRHAAGARVRRRRAAAVAGLALVVVLALAATLYHAGGDEQSPQTALRPGAEGPSSVIVSDRASAEQLFAEGGPGDRARLIRRERALERRRRERDRAAKRRAREARGPGSALVAAGVPLFSGSGSPTPPTSTAPPNRRGTKRAAPKRRSARRPAPTPVPAPAPAPPQAPVPAAPPPPSSVSAPGGDHHHEDHDHDDDDDDDDGDHDEEDDEND